MSDIKNLFGALPIGNGGDGALVVRESPCVGAGLYGCMAKSKARSWYCSACAERVARDARTRHLADARESISPNGALDWCTPQNPQWQQATQKLRTLAEERARGIEEEMGGRTDDYASIQFARAQSLRVVAREARLPTATQGALIIGPRRIGKSKVLSAIGLALCERAKSVNAPEGLVRLVSGMRFINGVALSRAAMDSGGWKNSPLYHVACSATLLLLDEAGYEDQKSDPTLVRDILRIRYEVPSYRPTVMASGATIDALNDRYGEAAISTVWERGLLMNLHPSTPSFGAP
jgi:DNA replication protein DnaC